MLIVQLFCIFIFSKIKFGQANDEPPEYEMNVLIKWDRSKGMQNLFGSDERFQLYLHRMIRQYGMTTQPLIASAKTGHYDLATLKIAPQQQIAIQNAVEAERKRKGKEKVGEGSGKNMNMNSENGIKFILLIRMKNRPGVQKEIEKLPNENEVLICSYDKEDKCKIVNDEDMFIRRPVRNIFFSNYLQNTQFLKFGKIECAKTEKEIDRFVSQVLIKPKENGMEYFGPICPSDEYIMHLLVDGRNYNVLFKCDETIPFHKNTYHFSKDKCQLLKENETFYNLSNLQGLLRMLNIVKFSPDFVAMMKELQKRSKQQFVPKPTLPSPSQVPNKSSAMNLGKQFIQQNAQPSNPHQISPKIPPPSVVIPPTQKVAPQFSTELMKQLAEKLAPYFIKNMPTQFRTQLQHQISQAGTPPRTVSHIEHSLNQSQSSNQIHRSSVGASEIGQNALPTNFQPSKIVGTSTQQQPQTNISSVEISPQSGDHQKAQSSHQSHPNPPITDDSIMTGVAKKIWEQIVKEQPVLATKLSPEDIKPIVIQFLQKQRQQIQFNSQPSHVGSPSQSQHFLSSGKWHQQFNLPNSSQQILNNLAQNLHQHLANSQSLQNADKSHDELIIESSSARKQPLLQIPQQIYGQQIGPFQFPSMDSASQQSVEASASRKGMPIQTENPPQHESPSIQDHPPNIDLEFNLAPTGSSNKQTKQKQFLHSFEQRPSPFNLQMSEQEISDEQINLGLGLGGQKRGPNDKDEEGPSEKNAAKKAKKN